MFSIDDYPAHALYVMDFLIQRQRGQYWYGLFDHALRLASQSDWGGARRALDRAIQTAEATLAGSEETLARYRGVRHVLTGACYVGQGSPDESFLHYKYADKTFVDATDYYGSAVTCFAHGLAFQAIGKWRIAYGLYTQAVGFSKKPIPVDDVLRRMRVDLDERILQAKEGMFVHLDDGEPTPVAAARHTAESPAPDPPPVSDAPPVNEGDGDGPTAVLTDGPEVKPEADPAPRAAPPSDERVRLYPIYQDISAGPGIWSQSYRDLSDFLETEQVLIKEARYRIEPLTSTGSRILQVQRQTDYGVFQVKGDSMNARDILVDDFVLAERLDRAPSTELNGAIVCALVGPQDESELVVKRFEYDQVLVTLYSENREDKYPPQSYEPTEVLVLGKVVAVLKKMP